jgi:hypothetical protein
VPRAGPYLAPDAVAIRAPKDLPTRLSPPPDESARDKNLVFVDAFEMPILYYAANARHASSPKANICTTRNEGGYQGVYNFGDNAMFTGGKTCRSAPSGLCIDFTASAAPFSVVLGGNGGTTGPLEWGLTAFETTPPADAAAWATAVKAAPNSFAAFILDRAAFESSGEKTVIPVRKDGYILLSPGKDGLFGTRDDVANFEQQ